MICNQPTSHIVDSRFYSSGYTTIEARQVFCDFRRMQRWLDVEAALAECQAAHGIIPEEAADKLSRTARLEHLDIQDIRDDIARTGHSLIPLLTAWQKSTDPEAAHYIHFGATTQDIQDTAQSLELRDIITIVERDLVDIIKLLTDLAGNWRDQLIIGRTHGQHALPTTLGLKFSIWLDETIRNMERLQACKKRVLVSQLFGGVGTMAALGDQADEILQCFSKKLALSAPLIAWHTARDRIAEFLSCLAIISSTLGKIANEICQLARNEIGELEEPFHMGKIGSTTMPHKRNPELCEQVVVLAKLIKSCAGLGFEAMFNEHERDYRSIRLEWVTVTDSSLYTCGATSLMKSILSNLIVHKETIWKNIQNSASLLSTEALLFLLGKEFGKQAAHQMIYEASMAVYNSDKSLIDQLLENNKIAIAFSRKTLLNTIDPTHHIGLAGRMTDTVIQAGLKCLNEYKDMATPPGCPLESKGKCSVNHA